MCDEVIWRSCSSVAVWGYPRCRSLSWIGDGAGEAEGTRGRGKSWSSSSYKSCRRILISGVWAVRVVDYMFRAPREFGVGRFPDGLAVAPARLQHAVRRLPRISTVMLDALPR